jgi:hypothetical protein
MKSAIRQTKEEIDLDEVSDDLAKKVQFRRAQNYAAADNNPTGGSPEEEKAWEKYKKNTAIMAKRNRGFAESSRPVMLNGKDIDMDSLEVDGVDHNDHPDYSDAYFSNAKYMDGTPLDDHELDDLTDNYRDIVNQMANHSMWEGMDDENVDEAGKIPKQHEPMTPDELKDYRPEEPWNNPRDESYELMMAVKAAPVIKIEPFDKGSIQKALDGTQNQIKELEKAAQENPRDNKTKWALEKAQARLGLLQARIGTADPKATNIATKNALTIEHLSTHVKDDKISLLLSRISEDYATMSKEEQREVNAAIKEMMSKIKFVPMFSAESTTFEELENLLIKREDTNKKREAKIDYVAEYARLLDNIISEGNDILSKDPDVQNEALTKLNDLMTSHFPAGTNGINAIESLRGIIDDPELSKTFQDISKEDADTCVRPAVMDWIKENAPQLSDKIDTGDLSADGKEEPAPEPDAAPAIAPAPEAGTEDTDTIDHVAQDTHDIEEYVESLYDKSTGNFPRGETGILVSVAKKFGDSAVPHAKKTIESLKHSFDENLMRMRKLAGVS